MTLVLATVLSLAAALLLSAAPASARVKVVGETTVGLQPREVAHSFDATLKSPLEATLKEDKFNPEEIEIALKGFPSPETFSNVNGAPVMHATNTYAIYWDPTDHYHGDWQEVVDTFFHEMGAASGSLAAVFAVDAQYTDQSNLPAYYHSTFRGAYTDTDSYPASGCTDPAPLRPADEIGPIVDEKHTPVCLTDGQIRTELETFVGDHGLQKGMESIFYLLTPPGVTVCLDEGTDLGHCSDFVGTIKEVEEDETTQRKAEEKDEPYTEPPALKTYNKSFCSYHSDINPTNSTTGDASTILYAVIPWIAGGLGDPHLLPEDKTSGYDCQDGGFDPTNKEEKEAAKEAKPESKEEEEHPKNAEEKRIQAEKEAERAILEGPHQQEPNQQKCPPATPDGGCDTGLADLIINQIASEQQNTVTDPLLDAWQDKEGNELTDECRNFFAPSEGSSGAEPLNFAGTLYNQILGGDNYYLNEAFNAAALKLPYPGVPCTTGVNLIPHFTAPNPVNAGDIVGFDGMESDVELDAATTFTPTGEPFTKYAIYKWNFGDGTPEVTGSAPGAPSANSPATAPCEAPWVTPCAASTYHAYQYGGTYNVTLTITDVGGNVASITQPITVVGPPAPTPAESSTGGSVGSGGSGAQGGAAGTQTKTVVPIPAPQVIEAALSKSLRRVLRSGLVVGYSVNEQVAGRFDVILSQRIADRLHIQGTVATGLPAGSEPSVVIAHAILVTTKGGRSTLHIKLPKATASRLRKLHKLSLMVRVTVRNAAKQNPLTATALSSVLLVR